MAEQLRPEFSSQQLANAAWALAELRVPHRWCVTPDELNDEEDAKALVSLATCGALAHLPADALPEVWATLLSQCEEANAKSA